MWEKLKFYIADDTIFFSILLVLIGVLSFGLGRYSVLNKGHNVSIQQAAGITLLQATSSLQISSSDDQIVVASKSGKKYHLPDCPGAAQIKDINKISFSSILLAEAAGYAPAANCPGLQ